MKNVVNSMIRCSVIIFGVLLIIHRRVIAAWLTGSQMPEPPEWHKKYFHIGDGNTDS